MSDQELAAFREALRRAPGSTRELARAAGLSHALLVRIRDGERGLTRRTYQAVLATLRAWGDECHELADALEAAAGDHGGPHAT